MNPTTQPSEGAVRAAKALELAYGLNPLGNELNDIAALIERETGVGELVEALRDLLGHAEEIQRETRYGHDPYFDRARQALSRHTSTQGKEGKL